MVTGFVLLGGIVTVAWLNWLLPLPWLVLFWSGSLLAGAAWLRPRWRHWFGPVMGYDLVRTARRGQLNGHRALYAVFLLLMLLVLFWSWFPYSDLASLMRPVSLRPADVAQFANSFFTWFMVTQFVVVLLVTPAYTSGAIADERERRTLGFLLATDLSNREIVLGMLGARLANLSLLIVAGLPVLSLLLFLGGVDPNLVLAGFLATLMTMASLGSLSMLVSVYARTTLQALISTYLWMFMLLVGSFFGLLVLIVIGQVLEELAGTVGFSQADVTVVALVTFAAIQGAITVFQCRQAIAALRNVARELNDRPRVDKDMTLSLARGEWSAEPRPTHHVPRPTHHSNWGPEPAFELVDPKRTGWPAPTQRPSQQWPPVGDNALLWKELHYDQRFIPSDPGIFFTILGGVLVLFLASVLLTLAADGSGDLGEYANGWVRGLEIAVSGPMYFVVALSAARRVSRERERQTLEGLLTLPVAAETILFAKWLGSILTVRWFWWVLAVIWLMGVLSGGISPFAVPFLVAATIVYTTFAGTLGLWLSTVYPTTLRATLLTVLAVLAAMLGPGYIFLTLDDSSRQSVPMETFARWEMLLANNGLTPPETLRVLSFRAGNLFSKGSMAPVANITAAVVGLHCYMGATVLMWIATRRRLAREKGPPPSRVAPESGGIKTRSKTC
jgi:ABC-type transport system involved in multi-copper enzyme maturation permease subunit